MGNQKSVGMVLWLTGLSGAGKTTIARALEQRLGELGVERELLDGDAIRHALPSGFSPAERDQHVRRVGFLASRLEAHGVTVICALISPYADARAWVRAQCRTFVEIHVSTALTECERRDPKGLYAAARRGAIAGFTGIDAPYEVPRAAEVQIDTTTVSVAEAVDRILSEWSTRTATVGRGRLTASAAASDPVA
jgi:adenylyl-sulfate kinase